MCGEAISDERSDGRPERETPPATPRDPSTARVRDSGLSLCRVLRPYASPQQQILITGLEGRLDQGVTAPDVPALVESLARLARLVLRRAALRDGTPVAEAVSNLLRDLWRAALVQLLDGAVAFLSAFGRELAGELKVRVAEGDSHGVEEACGEVLADLASRSAPTPLRNALGRALFEYLLTTTEGDSVT